MKFHAPLVRGTLVQRYKRFMADVVLDTGETPLRVLMGSDNRAMARMKIDQLAAVAAD